MVTVSLCMIVKNEEAVLARCLDSVRDLVEEILIADTGSSDRTAEIARQYTPLVFFFPWQDDFSAARNASFARARMDYCLWLDADDVMEEEDRARFLALKESLSPDADVVMLPYHGAVDEQGRPTLTYYRERLLRREKGFRWQGAVHESITPQGNILYSDAAITHRKLHSGDSERNLRIYQGLLARGKTLSPRDQFYYGRELFYHQQYGEACRVLEGFLDAGEGWKENCLEACRVLSQCRRAMGEPGAALAALLRGLEYGPPRGEFCCDIGGAFFEKKDYETALFWYDAAARQSPDIQTGGFVQPDCYGYIPWLQMSVCWYWLGDLERAVQCNETAETFRPGDLACRQNRAFYQKQQGGASPGIDGCPLEEKRV